jgi:predicted transcriptional regulator
MLEQLFSSRTRVKLLQIFLINPDNNYFIREIGRKIGEHINSVRRELKNLTNIGLVTSYSEKQKIYYKANKDFFLYPEIKALVFKAQVMMEQNFIKKLKKKGKIRFMALTGFFTGRSDSQTDILIVGSVNRNKFKRLIAQFQKNFDYDIHYTIMSMKEFQYRRDLTDRFLYDILENKKIVVIDKIAL